MASNPTSNNYQFLLPTPLAQYTMNAWGGWLNTNTSNLDTYLFAQAGNFIGSIAPTIPATSLPTSGQYWLDNSSSPWVLNMYDGTNWVKIGSLDPSTHSWSSIGAQPPKITIMDTSGVFSPSPGAAFTIVDLIAGGGGGGGVKAVTGTPNGGGASGGGAGSRGIAYLSPSQIGSSQTVTIGAGGNGGIGDTNGLAGGNSNFGTLITTTGGSGGTYTDAAGGSPNIYFIVGGNGGTIGTGGDINIPGWQGSPGFGSGAGAAIGGEGANTVYGAGGNGGKNSNGNNASTYGGGGGGASITNAASGATFNGGAGSSGVAIITEYY